MQIEIRGIETDITDDVRNYAEDKINKLSAFGVKIIQANVVLEEDHNKTENKAGKAKVLLKVAGKDIEAVGKAENVYAALDVMFEKAKRQLVEHKEKFSKREQNSRTRKIIRKILRRR